jgi:hypothetical protein
MLYQSLTQSPILDSVQRLNFMQNSAFRKPAVRPSSGKEAPNLVDPLDRAVLSQLIPQKHSACLDVRLRTDEAYG